MLKICGILLLLIPTLIQSYDHTLISSIHVAVDNNVQLSCKKVLYLTVDGTNQTSTCYQDGTNVLYTYSNPTPLKSVNVSITLDVNDTIIALPLTGIFAVNQTHTLVNTVQSSTVALKEEVPATTTTTTTKKPSGKVQKAADDPSPPPPLHNTTATLTISWVRIQYDDDSKKEKNNGNSGAVTVAVIEGIILIVILAFFGYSTFVKNKRKAAASGLYGYDNSGRTNDVMRMSDIPPPREPNYANPPPPTTVPQPARTTVVTPDLVVPTSPTTNNSQTLTPSQQFNDPFGGLDAW